MPYLMESSKEAERLLMKGDEETSRDQLLLTGLDKGMTAIDAGGGAGFVTKIMSEIVGPSGKVILLDGSKDRLQAAQTYMKSCSNVSYVHTPLEKINLADNGSDYLWCRFVFEYLQDPHTVFDEFVRVVKPEGKVVVGDLDYNCLSHYPLATHLEQQLFQITSELQRLRLWDPYAGRKLFSYFTEARMNEVQVHLMPHHLIYGESNQKDLDNWTMKLDQVETLKGKSQINIDFDLDVFRNEFLAFFSNPSRFSYSPLILVEGRKDL